MKFVNILFFTILISLVVNNSCEKDIKPVEIIKGCMDAEGKNYNPLAAESDGSCEYSGSVVFWYNEAVSDSLIGSGAVKLFCYIDTLEIGSLRTIKYLLESPECGQSNSISGELDLGPLKIREFSYSIKDQTGHEFWKGSFPVYANSCGETELLWSERVTE